MVLPAQVRIARSGCTSLRHLALVLLAGLVQIASSGNAICQDNIPPDQLEFFEKKIRPVLVAQCYSCHSKDAKSIKGGLVLDTREGIQAGGDSGHAVVPGEPESSLLMEAIRYESYEMPPKEQLPESVIRDFEKWINMGAPDPRQGPSLIKREIDFEEAKTHWSYRPIQNPPLPAVENRDWPRDEVDHFILAKLESKSLQPVGDADRVTLVRRLYYDLIGLPPSPEQLEAALQDSSPNAIENLVDELLASPHFGERWGRHWLDVVRYAESNGRERNFVYPNAWRYRDYVIESFNEDKPFDQFIQEQIAGDLNESPTNEELVATGFLAIGPKLLNEGNKNAFLMDLVDEQIDVTTRAFMGLTVSCARCHDHKFDPIPTREYYSMAGIFRSTETLFGTKKQQGNRQPSSLISLTPGTEDAARIADETAAKLKREQAELDKSRQRLATMQKRIKELSRTVKQKKSNQAKTELADYRRQMNNVRKQVQALEKGLKELESNGLSDRAMGVREGKPANSPVYVRGEVSNPKGSVPRGFLTILDPDLQQPILKTDESGRRELAEWIANQHNPLTSRVIVNRIWSHLFGSGIVRTVDNFGATGEPPTHPELLDHLAHRFTDKGWSVKTLIRELVLSRTYQLCADFSAENYDVDPDNFLLWRHSPQRVDAEAIRDAMLLASGELDVNPPAGSPVSKLNGEYGRQARVGDLARNDNHRSVYLPIIRNDVPEPLKLFDFAEPSILVGDRPVTTVPTQALYFLNSDFVTRRSDQLAEQLLGNQQSSDAEKIDQAYRKILSRPANGSEVEKARHFIRATISELNQKSDASEDRAPETRTRSEFEPEKLAWSAMVQALFGSAEFRYVD